MKSAMHDRGSRGYWETLLAFSKEKDNPPEAYTGNYGVAILYARLGEKDKSIDALEKAYAERQIAMTEIGIEPALDPLRSEPRFQELLRKVGLAK
jgi:hypothetical protein